jgi:hypothetical protein
LGIRHDSFIICPRRKRFFAKSFGRKVIKREQYRRAPVFGAGAIGELVQASGISNNATIFCR